MVQIRTPSTRRQVGTRMGTSKAGEAEHVHCPAQRRPGFSAHCSWPPPDPPAPPSTRCHTEPNRPHGPQT
eukprot:2076813-Rhodomonas_salina.1